MTSLDIYCNQLIHCLDGLITIDVEGGTITEEGVRKNTGVALKYINEWLQICSVPRIQPKVKYV